MGKKRWKGKIKDKPLSEIHIFYNKYKKVIPIIGLILLLGIYSSQNLSPENQNKDSSMKEKFIETSLALKNSFDFSDKQTLLITLVLLITFWTGYKYWLTNLKFIRRNSELLEKLVIAIMFIIFVNNHVKMNSSIGRFFDWFLFLAFLYLVLGGTWFLAKVIDGIDLRSDLYCWGLRLLGGVVIIFGFLLFVSSSLALTFSNSKLVFDNIYWILSVCLIFLGLFMQYRSFRRHPALLVWT